MTCGCGRTLTEADKTGATSYVCPACGKVTREERTSVWGSHTSSPPRPPSRSLSVTILGVIDLIFAATALGWALARYFLVNHQNDSFATEVALVIMGSLYLLAGVPILTRQLRFVGLGVGLLLIVLAILNVIAALSYEGIIGLRPHQRIPILTILIESGVLLILGLSHLAILGGEVSRMEFVEAAQARRRRAT